MTPKKSSNEALTRFQRLRWKQPHGATGLVSIAIGYYLVGCALRGNLAPYYDSGKPLVVLFVLTTILNGIFGYRLTGSAKTQAAKLFRRMAVLQGLLCYYILRFLPFSLWQCTTSNHWLLVGSDTVGAIFITLTILSCLRPTNGETPAIDVAAVFGVSALLLVAVYPIQLALGEHGIMKGSSSDVEDYWTCIQKRYPVQGVAMSAYIYLPATVTFSVIIFGATLYQREIVSPATFGASMVGSAMVSLLMTVLSQELHVPYVSTQRIYLPCFEPVEGSWEASVVTALDFSLASRHVLSWMGLAVPTPVP